MDALDLQAATEGAFATSTTGFDLGLGDLELDLFFFLLLPSSLAAVFDSFSPLAVDEFFDGLEVVLISGGATISAGGPSAACTTGFDLGLGDLDLDLFLVSLLPSALLVVLDFLPSCMITDSDDGLEVLLTSIGATISVGGCSATCATSFDLGMGDLDLDLDLFLVWLL